MLYFFKRDLLLPKVRSNLKIFFCKVVSQRVPEEELKSEFNREVARTIIPSNFPVELQLKFVLWDPLGPPRGVHRGVPEGPKGSQRDPEEELRSVFKGKVARNNGLKNDFF